MIAKHTTVEELASVAAHTGVRLENIRQQGHRVSFVLRLQPSRKYQRRSHSGRKVAAVCWHGHRDFFRELFRVNPLAEIRSHWAAGSIHYTAGNFERVYPDTGYTNIGSMMQPCSYQDACDCDE